MSKVLDPARELKRMCTTQVKGHRQALLFIAKSKAEGNLIGSIPQFIQAEMKAMGLNLSGSMDMEEDSHTADQMSSPKQQTICMTQPSALHKQLTEENDETIWTHKRKAAPTDTPDTVEDMNLDERQTEIEGNNNPGSDTAMMTATVVREPVSEQWVVQQTAPTDASHDGDCAGKLCMNEHMR